MNYELAKKLKDAGFPQSSGTYIKPNGKFEYIVEYGFQGEDWAYVPTLSELIEACGDGFSMLCREENNFWSVSPDGVEGINYKTPEEAVTNLYLELNKK